MYTNKIYSVSIRNKGGGNTLFMNRNFYKNNIKLNIVYNDALPKIIGFKVKFKVLICS